MKKYIFDYARKSKKISYGGLRNKNTIKGLVIHMTGNAGDTAKNNADFFATGNNRQAGAHIFIDGKGLSARTIPLNRVAWSVGNPKGAYKKGSYYSTLNNANTVSIELCDIIEHGVTEAQLSTLIKVCKWVKEKCPNIEYIVRHYDIVQKNCPSYYITNKNAWKMLQKTLVLSIEGV